MARPDPKALVASLGPVSNKGTDAPEADSVSAAQDVLDAFKGGDAAALDAALRSWLALADAD